MGLKIGFSREDQKTCDGVRKWGVEEDFWPERDEVTGEWRELHIAKGHDLYCSPDIITRSDQTMEDEMGEACGPYGGKRLHTWVY